MDRRRAVGRWPYEHEAAYCSPSGSLRRGRNEWPIGELFTRAWAESAERHGLQVDGPYVGEDQFAVRFEMDVTPKATAERLQVAEIALPAASMRKLTLRIPVPYNAHECRAGLSSE